MVLYNMQTCNFRSFKLTDLAHGVKVVYAVR